MYDAICETCGGRITCSGDAVYCDVCGRIDEGADDE